MTSPAFASVPAFRPPWASANLPFVNAADHGSLAAAVAAADDGATIFLPPEDESITEMVTIDKSLKLWAPWGYRILDKLPLALTSTTNKLLRVLASNVMIDGVTFDGSSAPAGASSIRHIAAHLDGSLGRLTNVGVERCRFVNLTRRGLGNDASDYPGQSDHPDGTNGTASLFSDYGVLVDSCDNVRVVDNYMEEVSGCGIFVTESGSVWVERNAVAMDSSADCLYHININESFGNGDTIWIGKNYLRGGWRASGGAVNVMSQNDNIGIGAVPLKRIQILNNIIEDAPGSGSGAAVIRVYSPSGTVISGNVVRGIAAKNQRLIFVDARTAGAFADQPGPYDTIISNNVLTVGYTYQAGITVQNSNNDTAAGGTRVLVSGNIIANDGTYYPARGIKISDIDYCTVADNVIDYKRDTADSPIDDGTGLPTDPFSTDHGGIAVLISNKTTVSGITIAGNEVDGYSSVGSRGIYAFATAAKTFDRLAIRGNTLRRMASIGIDLTTAIYTEPVITANVLPDNTGTGIFLESGTHTRPYIANNVVNTTGAYGVRLQVATITSPTLIGNTVSGSTGGLLNNATGYTLASGNRWKADSATAAIQGTWTIPTGSNNVIVNTTEVLAGDHIQIVVASASASNDATDKAVKVYNLVAGTRFRVGTVDGSAATANITGTWRIDH